MKQQISRISVLQTSKVVAILYAVLGFITVPFGCILLALRSEDTAHLIVGVVYLLGPIIYGVMGFIFAAIGIAVYNLVASRIGGIEFEIREVPSPEDTVP